MRLGYLTSAFGEWVLARRNPSTSEEGRSPFISWRPGPPLEEILPLLAEIGYDEVTISTWVGQEAFPLSMSQNTEQRVRRLADDLGLRFTALGSHGGSNHVFDRHGYLTPDNAQLPPRLRYTKRCIDLATRWGVPIVEDIVGQIRAGMTEADAWARARIVYEELCGYAEQHGVTLAIELISSLVDSAEAFLRLRREINSPALKCVVDLHLLSVAGHDVAETIERLAPYLAHAHTKGLGRRGETGPASADDILDQRRYIAQLVSAGYGGPLTVEEYPERYSPPLDAARSARFAHTNLSRILRGASA